MTVQAQPTVRPEAVVRAAALAHVRFSRRDPEAMARFLVDFGFVALGGGFFRAHGDGAPWAVEVVTGSEDAFLGCAFAAEREEDLQIFADAVGSSLTALDAPGGGRCVKTVDPSGYEVQLVFGAEQANAISDPTNPFPVNGPGLAIRVNETVRPSIAPAPVFKLGHVVLQTPNFQATSEWYMRHFGLIPTDVQYLPDESPILGFYRLNRGDTPTDHHTLALLAGGEPRLLHVSTETSTIDALGQGQHHLKTQGWTHFWGIGRHELGSQIFDYWKDSVGDEWEHYIDGDMMTIDYPTGHHRLSRGGLWTWGHDLPDSMRPDLPIEAVPDIHAAGGFGSMTIDQATGFIEAMKAPPRAWLK
ncbi:VOC family protein [Sphingopyxis granuli]|uniref:VOC family protein n=1 Tax=Sphingopyxis granuli TaxID=267128 RepID=UPI001BB0A306|nr:VOC family protein [Sphingopyxis granuli]QUM74407.1 VOC family protein [Sphingopyxis granuli]